MTMKMLCDLNQLFCDDMEDPIPELADRIEQSNSSFLGKLEKNLSADQFSDLDDDLLDLTGLYELRGFAFGLAVARRLAREWP